MTATDLKQFLRENPDRACARKILDTLRDMRKTPTDGATADLCIAWLYRRKTVLSPE